MKFFFLKITQPSVYIGSLRIDEPITTLTDLLVTAVCLFAYFKIRSLNSSHKSAPFFKCHFLTMALATFFGGLTGHAFLYALDFSWKLPGWLFSLISVALLAHALVENSKSLIPKAYSQTLHWVNILSVALFVFLTIYNLNFKFVAIHSVLGILLIIGGVSTFLYIKTKSTYSKMMLLGVASTLLAGLAFIFQMGIGKWFNHLDVSHLIMALGAYFFYAYSRLTLKTLPN